MQPGEETVGDPVDVAVISKVHPKYSPRFGDHLMKIGRNIEPTLLEGEKFYKTIYGEMVSHSNIA